MTGHSDFSDAELRWLARVEKAVTTLPDEIASKLVTSGVADRTDLGLEITGLGRTVLKEARINRRPL